MSLHWPNENVSQGKEGWRAQRSLAELKRSEPSLSFSFFFGSFFFLFEGVHHFFQGGHKAVGSSLWARFNAGPSDQLLFYSLFLMIVKERFSSPLVGNLASAVESLQTLLSTSKRQGAKK
ncbi:MAG TPA: hypothetical protein VI895_02765 [Bdellovibrionota bacterium]|nr:hypothetical protein [Bdellovibrionota bacterium]